MEITKDGKFTTYHDVKIIQGGLPSYGTEWWTEKDWEKHEKIEASLKASGEWGKPYYATITIVNNPLYDDVKLSEPTIKTASVSFIDLSKI